MKSLQEKIAHARRLSNPLPVLPYSDIPALIRARETGDDFYIIFPDSETGQIEWRYSEICSRIRGTASFLHQQGLKKGDRVATVSRNHVHTVVHYFACWMLGLVVVPVNLGEDDERIGYIFEEAKVSLAFVRSEYLPRIKQIVSRRSPDTKLVECEADTKHFSTCEPFPDESPESFAEADALIVFTSGTTGNPKGVVLTQRNLLEDARAIAQWHSITPKIRMMCVLPIHHVNGTVVTLLTPFYAGASVVLSERFHTGHFFARIAKYNVHIVSVVPTLLQYLTHYYRDKPPPETAPLRHVICGAGPLTVTVAQSFEERFKIPIIHGYGLSETTCYSCYIPVDLSQKEHERWMGEYGYPSIGIALDVNEMDIHTPDGKSVNEGERGEIVIRGVNVMKGYYRNEQANEHTFLNGWFRSGDEGFYSLDEAGRRYYFITGRLKELIIRGGVNLAPLEIDEIINRATGVKAGLAIGFENDWYGEEVGAYVQLKEGAEPNQDAIIAFCRKHLPFSKSPKVVVFGDDIPVTSTGKYQRNKLVHLFKEWKEKQFKE